MPNMKVAFNGEWVHTTPLSKRFGKGVLPKCEICGKISYSDQWFSIIRRVWRCKQCFTPEQAAKWE